MAPPVRVRTGDAAQDAARTDLERDQRKATASPLLGGVIVEAKTPDYSDAVDVIHRLGRTPQGWIVVDRLDAPFVLYREVTTPEAEKTTLRLRRGAYAAPGDGGSVDAVFKIYVF